VGRHGKVMRGRVPAAQQGIEWAAAPHAKAASLRPYMTAGIALVGACAIAVSPVTPSLPDLSLEQPAVSLLADSSILNIPVNLLIAAANIPYYESLALQEYAYALGPAGTTGGVPGWVPLSASATPGDGAVEGPDGLLYEDGGTGSWWVEDYDGNTWGWDDGNWPQMAAIAHAILPFAFTLPIVQQLEVFAEAEYIAGARVNSEFEIADLLGYLGGWLMFQTPLTDLLSGEYNYPNTVNAVDPATGKPASQPFWAGDPGDQLNPLVPFQAIAENLMQDPSQNPVRFPDLADVLSNALKVPVNYLNDYNPLVTGSFLYWGAPTLYSVPALLAGLVQNFTGIPNQFVGIGAWSGAGGDPTGGTAGPAALLTGLPAGVVYLAEGLLGYLNPGTYIGPNGISLSNTLLRTYAWGSLPGSDILRRLIGLDPNPAPVSTQTSILDAAALGEDLGSGAGSTAVQKDAPTVADLVGKLDATGAEVEQNNVVGNAVESLDVQQGDLAVAGVASTPGSTAGDILPVVRDEVAPEAAKSGLDTAVEATSGAGAPSSSAPGVPLLNVTRDSLKAEPGQFGPKHRAPGVGLAGAVKSVGDQFGSAISRISDGLRGGGAESGESSPGEAGTGE
jgi:hypothetical protein